MKLTNSELEIIRKGLPYGAIKKIELLTDHSYMTIWRVLRGYWYNKRILEFAVQFSKERTKEIKDLKKRILSE